MLIRNAEIGFGARADVRIADGIVREIGDLAVAPNEPVIDAGGAALLPGLHDHHMHFLAFAASLSSVRCGPPWVQTAEQLAAALRSKQEAVRDGWIRGIGYHPSVAGEIDYAWLDQVIPTTPVRIQHRSGRLWILNSRALDIVADDRPDCPLEKIDGRYTGRLFDADTWLRGRLGARVPDIDAASRYLLSRGVTGITDTTPSNSLAEFALFEQAKAHGRLVQDVLMMGGEPLASAAERPGLRVGARKFHLHDADLPDIAETAAEIARSHATGRTVAFHCVTLAELIFALGALDDAGIRLGDRIEHAAVAPPEIVAMIGERGLTVVTQPNFIWERGDAYIREVAVEDLAWLYRLRGFRDAGIALAGGTDAPFGEADPWAAMAAAVSRRSREGVFIGSQESLPPEEAFALFTGALDSPGRPSPSVRVGSPADLCLLNRSWRDARADLAQVGVALTIKSGQVVWSSQSSSASTNPHSSALEAGNLRPERAR